MALLAVRTFAPAFLADYAELWKAVKQLILPALGDQRLDTISAKDVCKRFDDLSVTQAASASRAHAGAVVDDETRGSLGLRREVSNPCTGLRRRKTCFEAYYWTD